jgi:hypothetical protein
MATYSHGVTSYVGTSGTVYGLRQSYSSNRQTEVAEARDATGNVADVEAYNETTEFSMEVVVDTAATFPSTGTTINCSDNGVAANAMLTGVNRTESGTDYKRVSLTARRWNTNGLPT